MNGILRRLRANQTGGAAVEFALLAPLFFAMLIGVLQIGVGMQNYNAVRNVTADVARYATIQYQTSNEISKTQMRTYAISTATSAPYLLEAQNLTIFVEPATTQRVAGATEFEIEVRYQVPTFMDFFGWESPSVVHSRPIFVIDE